MERKVIRVTKTSVVSLLSVAALSQFVVVHADTTSTTDVVSAPQESTVVPSSSDSVASENNTPAEMTTDSVVTTAVNAPATTYTLVPEKTPTVSAPVVLAAVTDPPVEPPVDEDIPNLEEKKNIIAANEMLDMIVEFYNDGGISEAQTAFEDSASDFAAINNIVDMVASKKALLQRIEDVRALIYGTTPTPVVTTRTEVIPMTTTYVADSNVPAGVQIVTTAGKDGVKTYTRTNGVEDKGVVTTPMTPKVESVGTKPTVVTESVAAPADIEQPDATLDKGVRVLVSPAKDGSKTTTTTYSLDTSTGKVTANTPTVTTVAGQAAVYRVGTKAVSEIFTEVVTKTIPFKTIEINKSDLEKGKAKILKQGLNGLEKITYRIVKVNGVEISREVISEELIQVPKEQLIEVGTKSSTIPPSNTNKLNDTKENRKSVLSDSEFVVTKQQERQLPESGDSKSVVALISGMLITIFSTLMLKMSRR